MPTAQPCRHRGEPTLEVLHADVIEHHYASGRRYFTVECSTCMTVLNSGHHYDDANHQHAVYLAARHNGTIHRTSL